MHAMYPICVGSREGQAALELIAMGLLFNFAIAVLVLHVIWTVTKPRWQFQIVVRSDRVEFVKGVPDSRRKSFEAFFLNDLKPSQKLFIYGRRETTGRLTTLIKGTDDKMLKQRIRNFLVSVL